MDPYRVAESYYSQSSYIRGCTPATVRSYRTVLNYYFRTSGILRIEDITTKGVEEFLLYGRVQRKWCINTYISFYQRLNVFLKWCVDNQFLTRNPLEEIPRPKPEKRLPTKLTRQEAIRLLEVIYNYPYEYKYLRVRNHAIFSMFIFAGLRRSELLKLQYTDVDIPNMTIFVSRGKGSKDRIIPMSYALAGSLSQYLEERKRLKKTCPEFFASLNRNMGYTNNGLKRLIVQMSKESKIKFTAHKLRHTFATLMLEGGCDIYSLSKMMGHADIQTTTIYLAASPEHLRSQMVKHPLNNL